ncbi:MAG: pyrroline-5-carboxylate reductase [Coriobacteriia bacterium]|nr:pyrroline-5-carboxylate reductase [Coriobacteriia bacterium]MBN2841109.1 pyrroline-5-carboxylate reductase [Coriobacteriia bacterium]
MSDAYALAIVGGGRMGEAIAAGLVASGVLAADRIVVAEPSEQRREVFVRQGIATVADGHEVAGAAEIVVLAVKPQVIDAVLAHMADEIAPGAVVVSIAVGVTTSRLEALLPAGTPVVRVMPNTPTMVGQGMAVISGGSAASAEHVERVRTLFEAVGETVVIGEQAQDAAAAISGSGPAYAAMFVDALARAGVRQGLSRDVAQALAIQTLRGTMELLSRTGMHPEELVDGVTSPGGTTIAAVEALEAGGLRSAVSDGVAAAVRRAKELSS